MRVLLIEDDDFVNYATKTESGWDTHTAINGDSYYILQDNGTVMIYVWFGYQWYNILEDE